MKYDRFLQSYFSRPLRERMTLFELAAAAGVSKNSVFAAKHGRSVSTKSLRKILEVLGLDLTVSPKETPDA